MKSKKVLEGKLESKAEINIHKYKTNPSDYNAFYSLVEEYTGYAKRLAIEYYMLNKGSGVSVDDLQAVCLNAIYIATKHFEDKEGRFFYPYWKQIAENEMIKYLNDNSYAYRASYFQGSISLDGGQDDLLFAEVISDPDEDYKNIALIDDIRTVIKENKAKLNVKEHKVITLMLDGFSQKEVATMLGVSKAQICQLYHSSLVKLRKVFL